MDVNMITTIKGQVLKAKMETGVPLEITRIIAGAGRTDNLEQLESLVNYKQELTITGKYQRGTQAVYFAVLTNKGLAQGYDLTQLAICANDPDDGEIVYKAAQLERAFPISAEKDFPNFAIDCTFTDTISNASAVTVVVDPAGSPSLAQFELIQALTQEALTNSQDAKTAALEAQAAVEEGGGASGGRGIISDTPPENPTDGMLWRKPIGSFSFSGELGGSGAGGVQPLNVSGVYIGETPPEDTTQAWLRPKS